MRALLLPLALPADLASAATFTVTKAADTADGACDADCSLREALAAADAAPALDTVAFAPSLAGQTLTLTRGQLLLTGHLIVDGAALAIAVSGDGASRVFEVDWTATAELIGLTIKDGFADGPELDDRKGGAIYNGGALTLTGCTVRNSSASLIGGGIFNEGTLTLSGSAVEANDPGGITNWGRATLDRSVVAANLNGPNIINDVTYLTVTNRSITNSSGSYESVLNQGGGDVAIWNSTIQGSMAIRSIEGGASVFVKGSTLVGSISNGQGCTLTLTNSVTTSSCFGEAITSGGYNAVPAGLGCPSDGPGDVEVRPQEVFTRVLRPFGDYGGPTRTYALRYGVDNPALDIGGACGPTDQRGFPAPVDGPDPDAVAQCDAGAVEAGAAPPAAYTVALTPTEPPVVLPPEGGTFAFTFAIENGGPEPQTFEAWTEATLPNGSTRLALGPVTVVLGPGESASRALVQRVPAGAPAGSYTYAGYVGAYPDGGVAGDSFVGAKAPGLGGLADAAGAEGWAASYAGGGGPVGPSDVWGPAVVAKAEGASALAPYGARPNPSAGRTTLAFALAEGGRVRVAVYDALGREVAVVVEGPVEAGQHEVAFDVSDLRSGVYMWRLVAGERVEVGRLTVAR